MATNEGTELDLSAFAEAAGLVISLAQSVVLVIPLLTAAVLLLSHLRHGHDRRRNPAPLWCSSTTVGTRYLFGEISHAEYRRATASSHSSALR